MIKGALDEMICVLKSRNFAVQVIMSDGEGAIGKIRFELMALGIELDISAAGGHVARIERRIQMVKERARAHICGRLPFTLTDLGNTYLVLYCVSRINCQQSGSRPGGLSPRELYSGRRVDGNLDFRAAFGDYAVCTVPKTDNTMTSRTEDCIVMLPTHNRTGSFKMLSLSSGKIVTRDQFKILPMPQSVVNTLNAMASREGKKITKSSVHVFDELLFANSLDKSNMPRFITNPPTQDTVETAAVGPQVDQPQPTIADLPTADNVLEIPQSEVGGGVSIPEHRILESEELTGTHTGTESPPPPSTLSSADVRTPVPSPVPELPATDSTEAQISTVALEQSTQSEERVIEFFRSGEGAFVTTNPPVRSLATAHSIEDIASRWEETKRATSAFAKH